ncbi:MAG: ribonucleoside-diphosphate reductase, adenosylcobalamin-dependent [Gammaproteobacteria bacterium RIFCSPHIGHO2_12_FULL_43_28]|nr:MAG: ribonucleoside-diphosphate reductase, adenosylcobalamin-dependent [Gammaproteobacteria bacterium RIFCSPHIGHO2_12_FULL_43_28]
MTYFKEPISNKVWDIKYRYRDKDRVVDETLESTWLRVATTAALPEKAGERSRYQQDFYRILEGFTFLPGGRILAGAGTSHQVTLFNCFVMDIAEDSLTGIFDALREGALTLQQGGGVGYDFSVLRPFGELVKKTGIPASGPVSFMRIWDAMCSVLLSTGARRGAMMGVLRCDHPDIESFIKAKSDPHALRHFNVSVMVSDAFMAAVERDEDWPLIFPVENREAKDKEIIYRQWGPSRDPVPCRIYRVIKARTLWQSIIRSAYDYAEPGVLFGDTINRLNNLGYRERINATNPCGEIPLPAYGACDLGAINLTQFVIAPFSENARLNWQALEETVHIATRFLDNVIEVSHYPLEKQQTVVLGTRRIGLGITGLADVFVMVGLQYGCEASLQMTREIMQRVRDVTWETSIELAKEKGKFPYFAKEYLNGEFVKTLDERLQKQLAAHGVRNSHHNTVAPTGTTSLLANNVSNGIEPIFKPQYNRHVRLGDDELLTFCVKDYALRLWQAEKREGLPPAWIDTATLTPLAHLHVQGAVQPFVDNAISKTINIPRDFPFESLYDVYTKAHALHLKGCTIFRPNPVTGSVLEEGESAPPVDHCCPYE